MCQNIKDYNTFQIDSPVKEVISIQNVEMLQKALKVSKKYKVLGGGSNILITGDLSDTDILKIEIGEIKIEREFKHSVYISAGAGVVWHDFVITCVEKNLGGIENLSLIPGTVGASPIQNIGAYGVEIKDVFHKLKALNVKTGKVQTFYKKDCAFGYRDSIFKNALKGKYIITEVWFKLSKAPHRLHTGYGAIEDGLKDRGVTTPTIKEVSQIVIDIRNSKLPNPKEIGNAGSFFKNPVVSSDVLERIKKSYTKVPAYPQGQGMVKMAAGWLIEQSGWKGKKVGETGVHERQALVLVNHGNAGGRDIYNLAQAIQESVLDKFAIKLEMEVNVWD